MRSRLALFLLAMAAPGCALNRAPMPPRYGEEPPPPTTRAPRQRAAPESEAGPPPLAALEPMDERPVEAPAEPPRLAAAEPSDPGVVMASAITPVPIEQDQILAPADDPPANDSMATLTEDPGKPSVLIAAVVGNSVITLRELKQTVRERAKQGPGWEQMPRDARNQLARETLEYLIDRSLLVQSARAEMKDPKKWDPFRDYVLKTWTDDELPALIRRQGVRDEVELEKKLAESGDSIADRRESYMAEMIAKFYVGQKLKGRVARPGSHEVYTYYRDHLTAFGQSAEVRWREVFIPIDAQTDRETALRLIEAARNRARSGEDFAALATEVGRGPKASQGGLWTTGYESFGSEAVRRALKELKAGEVSEILEDPRGFYLVKVESHRAAGPKPLAEVQEAIEHTLVDKQTQAALEELMSDLLTRFPVSSPAFAGTESEPRQSKPRAPKPRKVLH